MNANKRGSEILFLIRVLRIPPRLKSAAMFLEAEPNLGVDATIVSTGRVAKSTKAARSRRRLPKQSRTKVAHRITQVRVIQNVVEVQRERQAVTATGSAATAKTSATWTTPKAAATATTAAWSAGTTTTTSHAATHHRGSLPITLTILTILIRIRAAAFGTEAPRFANAQVDSRRSRSFSEVARNHHITRREVELEVAVRRAPEFWIVAVRARRCQRRTFEVERVAVEIASERDIERPA